MNQQECQRSENSGKQNGIKCGISCMVRTSLFAIAGICIGVITFWMISNRNQLDNMRNKIVKLNRKSKAAKAQIDIAAKTISDVHAEVKETKQTIENVSNKLDVITTSQDINTPTTTESTAKSSTVTESMSSTSPVQSAPEAVVIKSANVTSPEPKPITDATTKLSSASVASVPSSSESTTSSSTASGNGLIINASI